MGISGVARGGGDGGSLRSPEKGKSGEIFFGVLNVKTLKGGPLSVSVNSKPTVA